MSSSVPVTRSTSVRSTATPRLWRLRRAMYSWSRRSVRPTRSAHATMAWVARTGRYPSQILRPRPPLRSRAWTRARAWAASWRSSARSVPYPGRTAPVKLSVVAYRSRTEMDGSSDRTSTSSDSAIASDATARESASTGSRAADAAGARGGPAGAGAGWAHPAKTMAAPRAGAIKVEVVAALSFAVAIYRLLTDWWYLLPFEAPSDPERELSGASFSLFVR